MALNFRERDFSQFVSHGRRVLDLDSVRFSGLSNLNASGMGVFLTWELTHNFLHPRRHCCITRC